MKKGLLSILAGSLLVVGCQNYDDQFDNLESQISALASTVAGLSQVQSDLSALAGTVASLQSSLSSELDTALADGLADIDAAVASLEAATADVASSEDVAAIQAGIDANAEDLDELLSASSVYTGDVTINSVATLDIFNSMGDAIAIVNGNVDIQSTSDMDATKLQETIDNILTTVKDFKYEASSSAITPMTFNNLTGTATLTLKQAGSYTAKGLISATNIILKDDYKSKVTVIDFRALTSVKKFYTNSTADLISFNKALELHLTELTYYPPLDLTIVLDEGAAFPNKIDDVDADGDQKDIDLDIEGPASLTFDNILDGTMKFKNVASVTVNGYKGTFELLEGVETFNADKVVTLDIDSATDLETLNITGAIDPDDSADKAGPEITLEDNSSIENVTLAGNVDDVILEGNSSLTDVTISATVMGKINLGDDDAAADGNSDLVNVTLTGAKAEEIEVSNNNDLETLTIDLTFSGTTINGDISVETNTSLTTLNISSDKVENLTVIGNDDLTTLDFTGLATAGAAGSPEVLIYNNDLEATLEDDDDTASSSTGDGEANDLGDITSDSGIESAKTYLTAVKADADSKMEIFFDTVNFTTEADATTEVLFVAGTANASQDTKLRLAYVVPNTADTGDSATTAKRSFIILDKADLELTINNSAIFSIANLDDNNGVAIGTEIMTTANLAAATAAGATMTATDGAGEVMSKIMFGENSASTENSQTTAVKASFSVHTSDVFDLALDGFSLQMSGTTYTSSMTFANAVVASWTAKYATALAQKWDLATSENSSFAVITFKAKDKGTGSLGKALTASFDIESGTLTNMGYVIGNGNSFTSAGADNSSKGSSIVITLEATTAGDLLSEIGNFGDTVANGTRKVSLTTGNFLELTSTYNPNISGSNAIRADFNVYAYESRNDVRVADEARVAAASNAVNFSRIGWL